ncbi:helix-turn-helix transcriptional regulator [Streptococcus agalactiae]
MFSTFERIKELAKSRGISLGSLEEKLGLSRNSIYTIKNKKPSAERLQLIADYFNVSTDYLLGRTDNPNIASDQNTKTVDLKDAIAGSMAFEGTPLTEDEINYLADVFAAHKKMNK